MVLGLALTLLYRVWRHHESTEPLVDEDAIVVTLDRALEPAVNFS